MSPVRTLAAGVLVVGCSALLASTAAAQSAPAYPPALGGGAITSAGLAPAGPAPTSGTPSSLPFTGSQVALLAGVGAAALGGGTVLVAATRRSRRHPA